MKSPDSSAVEGDGAATQWGQRLVASPQRGGVGPPATAAQPAATFSASELSTENAHLKKENAEIANNLKSVKRQSDANRHRLESLEMEVEQDRQRQKQMEAIAQQERERSDRLSRDFQAQKDELERQLQARKEEKRQLLAKASNLQEQLEASAHRSSQAPHGNELPAGAGDQVGPRFAAETNAFGMAHNLGPRSPVTSHVRSVPRLPGSSGYPRQVRSPGSSPGAPSLPSSGASRESSLIVERAASLHARLAEKVAVQTQLPPWGTGPLGSGTVMDTWVTTAVPFTERPPSEEPVRGTVSSKATLFGSMVRAASSKQPRSASCSHLPEYRGRLAERAPVYSSPDMATRHLRT